MAFKKDVYFLPIQLGEPVATLQLLALGAVLTVFAQEHADSIVDKVQGPFKCVLPQGVGILNTLALSCARCCAHSPCS